MPLLPKKVGAFVFLGGHQSRTPHHAGAWPWHVGPGALESGDAAVVLPSTMLKASRRRRAGVAEQEAEHALPMRICYSAVRSCATTH